MSSQIPNSHKKATFTETELYELLSNFYCIGWNDGVRSSNENIRDTFDESWKDFLEEDRPFDN